MVRRATAEVREVAESVFRLNTEFHCEGEVHAAARDRFLTEHFERLSREINLSLNPPSGILRAELEAMSVEAAESELRGALDTAASGFAMQVCDLLDRMSDLDLVGLIDWRTETACQSYFYRDIIIQEELGRQTIRGARDLVAVHERGLYSVLEVNQEVIETIQGQHTQRHALCEMYLSEAKPHAVGDFAGIVPKDIRRFLARMPGWLLQTVRIIGGRRRSYRIIAQDVRSEQFEETETKIILEHERVVGCPLVTMGHYVLTGWGDEEDSAEIARQWRWRLLPLAIVLQLLAVVLFLLGRQHGLAFSYAAAVSAALALLFYLESRRQRRIAKSVPGRFLRTVFVATVWTFFSVGTMALPAGILESRVPLLAVGVGSIALGIVFLCARPLSARRE